MEIIDLLESPTVETFCEQNYLIWNQDVQKAIDRGEISSGKEHFLDRGHQEQRLQLNIDLVESFKQNKLANIKKLFKKEYQIGINPEGIKDISEICFYDFLDENTKQDFNIVDSDNVSEKPYDSIANRLIEYYEDGCILDFGSGFRRLNYSHVINYEIVRYISTDVVGVGEKLPFKDNSFDCILSFAVLEHVKDPFACAQEIMRCLKPNGILYIVVPLLQPYHGYPHHYYNMTHQGLANLFPDLDVLHQEVNGGGTVISSLSWITYKWAAALPPDLQNQLLNLKLADLIVPTQEFLANHSQLIRSIPPQVQMEMAAATSLFATKQSLTESTAETPDLTHPAIAEITDLLEVDFLKDWNSSVPAPENVISYENVSPVEDTTTKETKEPETLKPDKSLIQKIEHILRTTLHHFRIWKKNVFKFD